jgi:hypothetical protein
VDALSSVADQDPRIVGDGVAAVIRFQGLNPIDFEEKCLLVSSALGVPFGMRHRVSAMELLEPMTEARARPLSLSATTGVGAQPWHTDGSHLVRPPRYLVLGCLSPGLHPADTELLDRRRVFGDVHIQVWARREPFLVRSGRRSFYASILEGDEKFVRFDPGCMAALGVIGNALISRVLSCGPTYKHAWSAGDVLVVNNWRALHRRADATRSTGRALLRIAVA